MCATKIETCPRCAEPMNRHETAPRCRYNGWKNYETWAVNLWIGNEPSTYNEARERARECKDDALTHRNVPEIWTEEQAARFELADWLKAWVKYDLCAMDEDSLRSDLLSAALSEVDWDEIADALLGD